MDFKFSQILSTYLQVFRLGVSSLSDYHTPASDYMSKTARKDWLEERAFIALCLAAHRGHEELVVKLIENGMTHTFCK